MAERISEERTWGGEIGPRIVRQITESTPSSPIKIQTGPFRITPQVQQYLTQPTPLPIKRRKHVLEQAEIALCEPIRPVGAGGIAELTLVRHPAMKAPFVIKVARPELRENPHVHAQFEREWRSTRVLQHPGVVDHFSRGFLGDGRAFLTMRYLVGRSLSYFVHHPVTWNFLRAALVQLCDILSYIHNRGVLHQDLKPSNILVDFKRRRIAITDFGLARVGPPAQLHDVKSVLGTPAYMAPEQARGQLALQGPHTELYTVGVLLFELLAGHKPFEEDSDRMVMIRHCTAAPPELKVRPGIDAPDGIAELVARLLAKSTRARFENAAELKKAIKQL